MKTISKAFFIILIFLNFGFQSTKDLLSIDVKTLSGAEIKSSYQVENWKKNVKLITVSFTNSGSQTEYIKNVTILVKEVPKFNENTKFLYGGYDMGRNPIKLVSFNEKQASTESVFLAKNGSSDFFKLGILTWNIFRASIAFSKEKGIIISADGENKPIKPGETIAFEKLVIEKGKNWQDLLFAYGEQIAKVQNIQPKKIIPFEGWSTWDYYGQVFTNKEIESNIKQLKKLDTKANNIQIDGGWWTVRGDYLETRENIAGGMKAIAKLINDNGYTAGIHLDGFRAETDAKVYKEHPDWFLTDQDGKTISEEYIKYGKPVQRIYFDYSNPAARDYMKNVLKTIREDWGFKYFKIDFMRYGLNEDIFTMQKKTGLKEIKSFDPTMTSMERTRAGLLAMREGIADAFFLGCSSVFGPTLGLVDGLRTGGDINPTYEAYTARCLQNGGNFYLNQTVVQNDADYLVVRNKDDEEIERAWGKEKFGGDVTLNEAKMWADYVALFGGSKFSSDNLNTLRPERKDLVKKAFDLKTCDRFIPIDLWDKAKDKNDAFNIMLGTNEDGVYLALFNWGDKELGMIISNVSTDGIETVNDSQKYDFTAINNILALKLKARTSVIFKLKKGINFDELRKNIEYEFKK